MTAITIRLLSATLLAGILAQASATPSTTASTTARSFLATAFKLSAADMARVDAGEVFSRTMDVQNSREVATLGIVRINTTPARYVERMSDIVTFKRTDGILQIGTFSSTPAFEDIASLDIDEADLKRLRECTVGDCQLRLSADGIARARKEIDGRAPDARARASRLLRQLLVEYVDRYQQRGASAAMEYANTDVPLNVGREFASMLQGDAVTSAYAPRLRRHLLEYPESAVEPMTDFIYWSKELVRGRPVVSVTHVAIAAGAGDAPVAYAIGSKQIYAMHYYDASLGLTLLVPDRTAAQPVTYLVYLNRSRIDLFDGLFGGLTRRVVAGKARSLVAAQLQRLQGVAK